MDSSDGVLVWHVLAGERAAFGLLIERHRPMAVRLARRMLDEPNEAEDVAQEACLHAFLSLRRLRDPERFGAWLYGIVVNLARMRRRARRSESTLEDWEGGRVAKGFSWAETQPSPEAAYELRELHAIVLSAIALLPPEQQAVVRLHYFDGLSLAEIGLLAGAPLGTVKARLHRARRRLRAELAQYLVEYTVRCNRKEKTKMIEVVVQDVIMRASKPRDVVEAASRERPGPEAEEARLPLPPDFPAAQNVVMLKGDPEKAEAIQQQETPPFAFHRVVLLKEKNGERILPIWVGPHEADMLKLQLAEKSTPRPMTYELLAQLLGLTEAKVERVAVNRLHEKVFYATLWVRINNEVKEVDARPSDAINLALRVKTPIFADESVMKDAAVKPDALSTELATGQSRPESEIEWISAPVPDFGKPGQSPTEK
jgi:RNA polymerase sigma factor (sigma-70 family)